METLNSTEFYNRLAKAFDVMTDWKSRLAYEMPFIRRTLNQHNVRTLLDVACGTGWHSIALAQEGCKVLGCDASPAMIERARTNAAQAGVNVRFEVFDFTHLDKFSETFEAILCLGNSLPHLLSQQALVKALRQMRARLKSGGVVVLHNLNYDLRLRTKPRFFSANGDADTVVWRFADYGPKLITFHTALFERKEGEETGSPGSWSVQINSTLQRPLLARALNEALARAGLVNIRHFGGLDGSAFDKEKSGDLVIVASAE